MPFTRSIIIALNNEDMKGAEIIDAPGTNDQIASREARTKEMLKDCDVVFLISPTERFLIARI